jgi:hypothetical protein
MEKVENESFLADGDGRMLLPIQVYRRLVRSERR